MMERYRFRTGERLTYDKLAKQTGLSRTTIEALGSRPGYNTTLATIEKLCHALQCQPGDLLELLPDPPARKKARGS
jgi:putative transcriptional regulator